MPEHIPYGGLNWVEPNLNGLTTKSIKGRIYEVDISYPRKLHDIHYNLLPFLQQNSVPPGSKVRKTHIRNLQHAINNGVIVEKVIILHLVFQH